MLNFFLFNLLVMPLVLLYSCAGREKMYHHAELNAPYDVVIVPGLPYDGNEMSAGMKLRVLWSYHLYRNGITKRVMYSGSAVYTPYIEARVMADYAKHLGIPEEAILREERAEHSTENLFFGYRMARELGMKKVALASDPFQSAMLRSFARSRKMEVDFIPAIFDTVNQYWPLAVVNLDASDAKVEPFTPLPDRESFFVRLRGTFGKNIRAIERAEREAANRVNAGHTVKN